MKVDAQLAVKRLKRRVASWLTDYTHSLEGLSNKGLVFRGFYSLHRSLLRLFPLTPYRLTNHERYTSEHPTSQRWVLKAGRRGVTSRLAFGMEHSDFELLEVNMPDLYLFKHEHVSIQGNSDLVVGADGQVISDFSYEMDPRYVNVDGLMFTQKGQMALLRWDGKRCDRKLAAGIQLTGKFSVNYYHELYENMVKLLLVEGAPVPAEVPLLVDAVLFQVKPFGQLFETLNRSGREVLPIGPREMVEVGTLYGFSAVNVIPPHKLSFDDDGLNDVFFDWEVTLRMRERLLERCSKPTFPTRIFLSRRSSNNRQYNESELIPVLEKAGFAVVCPEEFDLFDQMALFNGAEAIIGASGAAFSNLLFCKPGCRILCIQNKKLNIPVFSTVAYALYCPMRYLVGKSDNSDLHTSFRVEVSELEQMLNEFMPDR